jgi:hypothetical protein
MIEDMTVRNLSPATAFQVHLVAGGISWPALNQTVCALRYFEPYELAGTGGARVPTPRADPERNLTPKLPGAHTNRAPYRS